jgi:hypothetical protein
MHCVTSSKLTRIWSPRPPIQYLSELLPSRLRQDD